MTPANKRLSIPEDLAIDGILDLYLNVVMASSFILR